MRENRCRPSGTPQGRPTPARPGSGSSTPEIREVRQRIAADQAAATDARLCYRAAGMSPVDPGPEIRQFLDADETPLAVRRSATLDRRDPQLEPGPTPGLLGDLVVTSHRVVLTGRRCVAFDLDDIEEATLSGEQLLLVMRNGTGVAIRADQPRLLRVQIAAARLSGRT